MDSVHYNGEYRTTESVEKTRDDAKLIFVITALLGILLFVFSHPVLSMISFIVALYFGNKILKCRKALAGIHKDIPTNEELRIQKQKSEFEAKNTALKKRLSEEREEKALKNSKLFHVVGFNHHLDNLMPLLQVTEDYLRSAKSLGKDGLTDYRIYRYEIRDGVNIELETEPTNSHNPHAVKVTGNGKLIGYIKDSECEEVSNILDNDLAIKMKVLSFGGGDYKCIFENEDDDGNPVYVEKDYTTNFFMDVVLYLK